MLTDGCEHGRFPGPLGICVDEKMQGGMLIPAGDDPPTGTPATPQVELVEPQPASGWVIEGSTSALQMRDFSDLPLISEPPTVDDVRQGLTGDCPVIATLAALAHATPGRISGMVSRQEADVVSHVWDTNNTTLKLKDKLHQSRFLYSVKFAKGDQIRVSGLLWQQRGVIEYGQSARGDLWPSILEKAFVVGHGGESYQTIFGTVTPEEAMTTIVGPVKELMLAESSKGLESMLRNARTKPTIAATLENLPADVKVPAGIIGNHTYAVVSLSSDGKNARVYNALDGATIDVPLATFRKVFETVVQSN
jgi:Calpain family cysteine protease